MLYVVVDVTYPQLNGDLQASIELARVGDEQLDTPDSSRDPGVAPVILVLSATAGGDG
jgi:hypothetical protein